LVIDLVKVFGFHFGKVNLKEGAINRVYILQFNCGFEGLAIYIVFNDILEDRSNHVSVQCNASI
jgi:hypothetical protein